MSEKLKTLGEVKSLQVDKERRLFSAQHEEIISGATTDIYFIKTQEILAQRGLEETRAVAEIFPRREGIMAGVPEVLGLLRDSPVEVWALEEGQAFASKEVIMRISGKYSDFGIYETAVLGILASSSGWATAARKVKEAAGEKRVLCFGARHVHPAVAPVMERAAIVGGVDGASCILAAKLAGKEPSGTVPHAVFLIMGDSVKVARAYHEIMPPGEPRTVLVDTFKDEAEEALLVAAALGRNLHGIRLDTPSERGGVTPALIREVRCRLAQAGFGHVNIFVSGGLDPERIVQLKEAGADAFGVGSYISGASPIDMTMDLKEVDGRPIAKRGRIPGITPNERLKRIK
ncbi:MAG: nicotinate phosphoribosyltransferase [Peptococcaceae bacterium]|jgi:nicotinate phosphoribosyltransferase|nr:nicotinate phosphoribosyltransferase [Peptococcaceae bacterium]MDH7525429.1 nicotinate phosphoribosyltransferase [Peptococcaceae bacterium]